MTSNPVRSCYTHTHPLNGPLSGTTRVSRYQKGKTNWILLKQETVSGSGIRWAICKSSPRSSQITSQYPTTQFFTGRMPFLPPNQQRQSTVILQRYFFLSEPDVCNTTVHLFLCLCRPSYSLMEALCFQPVCPSVCVYMHAW